MNALALCLCLLPAVPADEVELTSGTVVEGKVEDLGDSIRVVRSNGSAVYPKSLVHKITPKKTVEEIYADQTKALKTDDLDGRLKLARWCLEKKLPKEALLEFKKILAISPDHEEARAGAGFQKVGDKWLTEDEAAAARGLVKHKGRWMTPEQRALDVALDEQKELDKAIAHEVGVQIAKLKSSDEKKRAEAIAALAKIEDKHKAKAYIAAISSPQRETRKFLFEELGRMKEVSALKALVRRSLWDDDEALRPVAFRAVQDIGHPDTAFVYVPFLGEESCLARTRCVEMMAVFKDVRVAPALLQALDNNADLTHSLQSQADQTNSVARTVTLADGSSVSLPRSARIGRDAAGIDKDTKARLSQERSMILSTLGAITGQNLGDDSARWREWLSRKKAGN